MQFIRGYFWLRHQPQLIPIHFHRYVLFFFNFFLKSLVYKDILEYYTLHTPEIFKLF